MSKASAPAKGLAEFDIPPASDQDKDRDRRPGEAPAERGRETMRMTGAEAPRGLRWGVLSLMTVFAVLSAPAKPAVAGYEPPYADIVVDANSGKVLRSSAPDSSRHPASLTKIMTLYLLFERLEAGQLQLNSELPVSAHAAAQAPSKLGLKPGQSIEIEDAIKAIVTRSANDVAVVVAEALGGSEGAFAKLMTGKARALGMNRTVYTNASGLPDDDQITTARDQALLGRAIQERFPKFYKYFATTRFSYEGRTIRNHNRLLGKVEGVDGIKTGYTRDSGFNLVTSVRRANRHVVAVVLGGQSASARDARMSELIGGYIRAASAKRTAPLIAQPAEPAVRSPVQQIAAAVISPARADPAPTSAVPTPRPAPFAVAGSDDPLQPISVKTVSVKPGAQAKAGPELGYAEVTPTPAPRPDIPGVLEVKVASALPQTVPASDPATSTRPAPRRDGWMIQIGAFDQETEAKQRLYSAQSRAKSLLGRADPFTERVTKGEKTLYRARFAGLNKDQAEAACKYLKQNEIACMALKN